MDWQDGGNKLVNTYFSHKYYGFSISGNVLGFSVMFLVNGYYYICLDSTPGFYGCVYFLMFNGLFVIFILWFYCIVNFCVKIIVWVFKWLASNSREFVDFLLYFLTHSTFQYSCNIWLVTYRRKIWGICIDRYIDKNDSWKRRNILYVGWISLSIESNRLSSSLYQWTKYNRCQSIIITILVIHCLYNLYLQMSPMWTYAAGLAPRAIKWAMLPSF